MYANYIKIVIYTQKKLISIYRDFFIINLSKNIVLLIRYKYIQHINLFKKHKCIKLKITYQ
jgi:hypothetical protein